MALWTVYLSLGLLVALNASVETRPVEKNKHCGTCETGWTAFGCRCFNFYNNLQIWSSAEKYCLIYGGNLASVYSHDEYMFIKNLIRRTTHASTRTWIGLHHVADYIYWFWSDGTSMNYQIWSPGEPSYSKDEYCVEMNSVNGNWNDANCKEEKPFVCVK
ncbi:galactose-specific lectin nattectin-like [Chanodichthys erythropterus]|uniref:galactose-specific lectin nattectin-like n=1 Tax=Chanodichthys erythropterus TaxID=933992 RepID=UPI00351E8845